MLVWIEYYFGNSIIGYVFGFVVYNFGYGFIIVGVCCDVWDVLMCVLDGEEVVGYWMN